jgi:hypothetical protein
MSADRSARGPTGRPAACRVLVIGSHAPLVRVLINRIVTHRAIVGDRAKRRASPLQPLYTVLAV